ncbi:triose-phosphate transporter family-domain-containing protein [Suillus subluteus]|nr:triose-phosphate transporter family-domain-containing protein [Suillus subluteus]
MLDRQLPPTLAYNNYSSANAFDNQHLNSGEGWQATFVGEKPLASASNGGIPYARQSPSRARLAPGTSLARFRKLLSRYSIFSDLASTSSNSRRSIGPLTTPSPYTSAVSMSRFILLCSIWYTTSALSSNTGKTILNQWNRPVTLTIIQFAFVAGYCLLFMSPVIQFTKLRPPTGAILRSTLPMGMFQVGGHMFSSIAISKIPVSTVHTIKALSPLFTVAAYAMLFGVKYSPRTYFSLLPLIIGVMLAYTFESASNATGLLCAFGSASCVRSSFYPVLFLHERHRHFAQNIIAFVILSSTSPVTYSIASLIKRVAVICIAIVWFNQSVHPVQGLGIGMTFLGLYMYNTAKSDVERGENKMRRVEATRDMMLPINRTEEKLLNGSSPPTPVPDSHGNGHGYGHPNSHIQISPQDTSSIFSKRNVISPTEPYPSPPPSIDSPPSNTPPHIQQHFGMESFTVGHVTA